MKGNLEHVVVIDVECDSFPDVFIIDVPMHWEDKLHDSNGSRGQKKFPFQDVISIDDEEGTDVDPPGIGVECHTDSDSNANSREKSCHASSSVQNSGYPADDEDEPLCEKLVSNLSKYKWMYSTKVPSRNCYGLNHESESGSSDSDCSDCELIDSSFDTFREQWEKASLKRKNGAHKARAGMVDRVSVSGSHIDGQLNFSVEKRTKPHEETLIFSGSGNDNFKNEKQSTIFRDSDSKHRHSSSRRRANMHFEHKKTCDREEEGYLQRSQYFSESHTPQDNDDKLEDKDQELSQAHRLRKRKEAEALRLLDVERRQKQRVEEVRDTKKKDEEYMSLKEQIQVEIKKELKILEVTSIDMASVLRGLGVLVGGGFWSTSDEVHAAYKRAVLRFHPDRASRMDIRQQVEAEEKFKLITRMKEKFLS